MIGGLGGFPRQACGQVGVEALVFAPLHAADPEQILRSLSEDRQEGIEYGGNQNGATIVAFGRFCKEVWIRLAADILPERSMAGRACSKLLGEAAEQADAVKCPAFVLNMRKHRLGQREMREQRDNIGKGFVERETVNAGRLRIAPMQPVEHRMGRFMRDDIVRQRGEYPARTGGCMGAAKISEQQGALLPAVVRVRLPERMR